MIGETLWRGATVTSVACARADIRFARYRAAARDLCLWRRSAGSSHRCSMRVRVGEVRLFFDVDGSGLVIDGSAMRERPTLVLLSGGPGFDHSVFKPAYERLAEVAQGCLPRLQGSRSVRARRSGDMDGGCVGGGRVGVLRDAGRTPTQPFSVGRLAAWSR